MIANIIRNAKKTVTGGDPYYSAVSLLLSMDGTNGSTTFTNSSLNALTVTSSGVTISDTGARSGFGQFADFPGSSSSALTIPATSVFNFGTGDFTIEFWFNIPAGASGSPYGKTFVSNENNVWSAGAFSLYALASSTQFRPSFWVNEFSSSVPILLPSSGDYRDGNWHHLAVVRSGSAFSMYIDGVRVANGTHAGNCGSSTRNLMIGDNLANNGGDRNFLGKLDDLRISQFARYTSTFTPPAAALPTTASSTPADPYYGYTSLLLHMDGSSGSTNFVDSGPSALTVTSVGSAQISTTQSKFGGASGSFNGTSSYLSVTGNTSLFSFSGDFTVEGFVYFSALPTSGNYAGFFFARGASASASAFQYYLYNNAGTYRLDATISVGSTDYNLTYNLPSTPSTGTWYHFAYVRSGTSVNAYWNGSQIGSAATVSGTTNTPSTQIAIGGRGTPYTGLYLNGFIDEFRVTKYARYTSAFAPPAQAHLEYANGNDRYFSNVSLLLHMDGANGSTTFTDNSPNALALTATGTPTISTSQSVFGGASCNFPGTSYLSAASSSIFSVGTGDFTVEAWVNFTVVPSSGISPICQTDAVGTSTNNKLWIGYTGNTLCLAQHSTSNGAYCSWSPSTGTWYHIAVQRKAGTVSIYINGVAQTVTNSTIFSATTFAQNGFVVGGISTPSYFQGYIDDFRFTNTVARYSGTFTPPTTAFPNA